MATRHGLARRRRVPWGIRSWRCRRSHCPQGVNVNVDLPPSHDTIRMDSRKRSPSDENRRPAPRPWRARCCARDTCRKPGGRNVLLVLVLAVLAGCASLPSDYPRSPSTAMQDHESTPIGRRIAEIAAQHPGNSAFQIIRHGRPAFTARIALADLAQKTLDVQYFLWETDATGRNLVDHLVRAADRSVRVRILIDDFNAKDLDATIAALDAHPNIEVRLFNPFAHRGSHLVGFFTDFERINHRMHNKLMVMDNAVAIVGGRNMSDPYFEVHPEFNFRDLDIAAAGPVVRDLSSVFDRFWNGSWSVPIAALVDRPYTQADLHG